MHTLRIACVLSAAIVAPVCHGQLTVQQVASGLDRPLQVVSIPGDYERLFIVEEDGIISILDLTTGMLNPVPFLDLSAEVWSDYDRDSSFGALAFDPDYLVNGELYVTYVRDDGTGDLESVLARYRRLTDDVADPASAVELLVSAEITGAHNISWIEFGPLDGYLYVGAGDGANNPTSVSEAAQDTTFNLRGKILRLDVSREDVPGMPYAIPPDNPFVGLPDDDEIWLFGVRSPWRNAFDPVTGDLLIADVGRGHWEELSVLPGGGSGGENMGWNCLEGTHDYFFDDDCPIQIFVDPIHEYGHVSGLCCIIGGRVYRGCAIPGLQGAYLFADFCTGQIWSLRYDGPGQMVTELIDLTGELNPGGAIQWPTSFGTDALGEMYITTRGTPINASTSLGAVYKIVPAGGAAGGVAGAPTAPQNLALTVVGPSRIDLTWDAATDPQSTIELYNVHRDGQRIATVAQTFHVDDALAEATTYSYEVSAVSCDAVEGPLSAAAVDTTQLDTTGPAPLSASARLNPSVVKVLFDEPLDQVSAETAGNWSIDEGVAVLAAALGADQTTVTLTTDSLAAGALYHVSVAGVLDQAAVPNAVAPGASAPFWVQRVTEGLVTLYHLDEGAGAQVADGSAVGAAGLDLTIADEPSVTWVGGGLAFDAPTIAEATLPAVKIHQACTISDEITIEAWVTPANLTQTGPARIVTFSSGISERNFTLAQDVDKWNGRLRTTATNDNGSTPALTTPGGDVTLDLTHVVYTRDAGGTARLYVDGVERISGPIGGDLSNWDQTFGFALGNEVSQDRPWLGVIHLVAVYARALSAGEVGQNLALGADPQSPVTPGDLDLSGAVNITDLLTLLGAWGPCTPPCIGDIDGDGMVGVTDLLTLLANWG